MNVSWHPSLLVEITPHDGPTATGNHVFDDNNLAQKNISIVSTNPGSNFSFAVVVGHEENLSEYLILEVDRGRLPSEVQLFVDLVDPILRRGTREYTGRPLKQSERLQRLGERAEARFNATTASPAIQIRGQGWHLASYDGREVVFLHTRRCRCTVCWQSPHCNRRWDSQFQRKSRRIRGHPDPT
jgi:hypothetical protein